jgi:flagellar biosynthesis protein FlhG
MRGDDRGSGDRSEAVATIEITAPPSAKPAGGARSGPISVGPAAAAPSRTAARPGRLRLARAIAITSGKGGVGKTNLAVNLAIALAEARRVCLLDADLGLANADVLCGVSPKATLEDVLLGTRTLEEVMLLAPGGFRLVPGASGVSSVANLRSVGRRRLLGELLSLERSTDLIMIDTAAGIAANSMAFAAAAHTVLVAVTPEPTSITDAYGAIKTIVARVRRPQIRLIVNMATDREEGEEVFRRIDRVARTFLDTSLTLAGIVPFDPEVRAAVRRRTPFLLAAPDAPATKAVRAVARGLLDLGPVEPDAVIDPAAFAEVRTGFLARLAGWLARS